MCRQLMFFAVRAVYKNNGRQETVNALEVHQKINETKEKMQILIEIIEDVKSYTGGKNAKEMVLEKIIDELEKQQAELRGKLKETPVEI